MPLQVAKIPRKWPCQRSMRQTCNDYLLLTTHLYAAWLVIIWILIVDHTSQTICKMAKIIICTIIISMSVAATIIISTLIVIVASACLAIPRNNHVHCMMNVIVAWRTRLNESFVDYSTQSKMSDSSSYYYNLNRMLLHYTPHPYLVASNTMNRV